MPSHGVQLSPSGQLVVVRAAPPEDADDLRALARRLTRAAGAGVVDIVELRDDGETVTLVLGHAGRPVTGSLGADESARIGAAVAAALADLHLRDIVHGDVRAEHVLIDAAGEVRLCGLGARDADAADDVAALGALLRELLDTDDTSDDAWTVHTIADRCSTSDAASRPTAAAAAASLASIRRRAVRAPRPTPIAPPSRVRVAVLAGALLAALAVGGIALWWPSSPAPARAEAIARRPEPSTTSTTHARAARRVWPPPAPHVIDTADGRWTLGSADDRVLLGDWNADGEATPVVVRVDGSVYVVDEWAEGARGRLVASLRGVAGATVERLGDRDVLVVSLEDGRTVRPDLNEA